MPNEDIPPAPKGVGSVNGEELPEMEKQYYNFIVKENMILAQIEKIVIEEMKKYQPTMAEINGQKVGLRVKEIYNRMRYQFWEGRSREYEN